MASPELILPEKLSHQKCRAIVKKETRKKRRQEGLRDAAQEKDKEKEQTLEEEKQLEEKRLLEIQWQELHKGWLLREEKAQEEFRLKKEREEAIRKQQEEQERKLKEEWEEQWRKVRAEEEQKQQRKREREEAVHKMLEQAENQLENCTMWQNPEPPPGTTVMEEDRANCPFYNKTGACRFGDRWTTGGLQELVPDVTVLRRCSRKHTLPISSPTLLIKSMFMTFGMEQCRRDDYDTDANLEYSEEETYQQFLEFYNDVLPEFKNVGKVIQFKVSCNLVPHLRGNVYVQYQSEEECQAALSLFNGRWYAGRRLHCEFCPVTQWRMAICGLFETQQCSRGKHCNFLHVFRNPNNEFWEANRDIHLSLDRTGPLGKNLDRRDRMGHHDEYRSRSRKRRPNSLHAYKTYGEAEKKGWSSHRERSQKSSQSHERHSSQYGKSERAHSHREPSRNQRPSQSRSHSWSRSRSHSQRQKQSGSHSRSFSRPRSRGRRKSRSRDRTVHNPKS